LLTVGRVAAKACDTPDFVGVKGNAVGDAVCLKKCSDRQPYAPTE
jgi:hypothetical protein